VVWFNLLKVFLWTASIVFNICLCYDLITTIKHPFSKKGSLVVKYHIYSYIIGFAAMVEKGYKELNNSEE